MTSRTRSQDAAADIKCASYIRQLRAHLMHCNNCKGAIKANDHAQLCRKCRELILTVARYSAVLWDLKKAAYADPGGTVYACPDIRKHGETAQDTACPLVVQAYAERLF
jgi:hypothetical protein